MEQLIFSKEWAVEKSRAIDGWIAEGEDNVLYELASQAPAETLVVEIGSYKGRSTVLLGSARKIIGNGHVVSIDPHCKPVGDIANAYDEWQKGTYKDSYYDLLKNIEACGLSQTITVMKATSEEAFNQNFKNSSMPNNKWSIGFLFIDGLHERKWVQLDYDLWSQLVVPGGIIAFHDSNPGNPDFHESAGIVADTELVKSGKYDWARFKGLTWGKRK